MNWYYGRSYNLLTTDIWIQIFIWIHMIAIHPTYQWTFEFILKYELILWLFIQPTNKLHMNSYMCSWIHMVSVRTTNQRTFEFILMYDLKLWLFIQPTNKGHMNSYMYMNSYDGHAYNHSTDIWIHINVWIDIMTVYTTYTQRTCEFIQVYEFILWSFVQPINGHLNSY